MFFGTGGSFSIKFLCDSVDVGCGVGGVVCVGDDVGGSVAAAVVAAAVVAAAVAAANDVVPFPFLIYNFKQYKRI